MVDSHATEGLFLYTLAPRGRQLASTEGNFHKGDPPTTSRARKIGLIIRWIF